MNNVLEEFKELVEKAAYDLYQDKIVFKSKGKKLSWNGYSIHLDDILGIYIIITNKKKNFQSIFPKIISRKEILENVCIFM